MKRIPRPLLAWGGDVIIRFVLRSCHGDGFRPTSGSFGREAARHGAGPRSPTMTSSRTPSTPRDRWALVEGGSVALTARALARQQAALVAAAAAAGAGRARPGGDHRRGCARDHRDAR